jgi:hypothetical protein
LLEQLEQVAGLSVQLVLLERKVYKVLLEQLEHKEHKVQGLSGATGASGSSIPSGLDMQIQYNDTGADADFVWNKVTNDLILTGIDAGIILGVITTEPPVPAVGTLQIYSKLIAGCIKS